jgi:hypothetical protein
MITAWRCETGPSTQTTGNLENKNNIMHQQPIHILVRIAGSMLSFCEHFADIIMHLEYWDVCFLFRHESGHIYVFQHSAIWSFIFKINCIVISQYFIPRTFSHICWLIIVLKYKSKSISRLTNIFLFYCRYTVIDYTRAWTFIDDLPTKCMFLVKLPVWPALVLLQKENQTKTRRRCHIS